MTGPRQDALVVLDPEGRLVFASRDADAILGTPLSQAAGRMLPAVLGMEHPLLAALGPAESAGAEPSRHSVTVTGPDGRVRELRVARYPMPRGGGLAGTALLLQLDPVAAANRLGESAARMAELGRLTSGVAHELRNPLNALMIHAELLRRQLSPGAAASHSLEAIHREIRRLDRIVHGVLRFLFPAAPAPAPVALTELFRRACALVQGEAAQGRVSLVAAVAPDVPAVITADPDLLREALAGLLRNAVQAMPGGGRVLLRADRSPGGEVEIRVEDRGAGIPAADLDKVFRLYYTTRPGAEGIGLSLVYRIVELHGGRIRLESREARGTTAVITLPASLVPALEPVR